MGKLISFLSLLFLLSIALISSVHREVHASSYEFGKANNVMWYLGSRYNDTWKLLSNSEDSGFYYGTWGAYSKLYFLYTDNLLAYHALKYFALYWAEKIEVGLDSYVYPRDTLGVGVLFGENIPNDEHCAVNHIIVNDTDGSVVLYERHDGDVLPNWEDYADRVIYHALDCFRFGSKKEAFDTFSIAVNMFDGKGLYDLASVNAGWYANFKLGLLLYADWFMDYNMNCSDAVEAKLWSCQDNVTGGIHTATNMTTGEPFGSSNIETSALALLPYTLEPSDHGFYCVPNQGETGEGTLEMGFEFLFLLFVGVVIVIVVWGLMHLTREKKGTVKHEPRYDRE
jgi:hypothetical protein